MREPPKLATDKIAAALETGYGLAPAALAFLPLGNDSASFVYRAATANASYFLKVRTGSGFSAQSLAIPRYLHERGVPHILAPLPTGSGALWVRVGEFALSVYPFIQGRVGAEVRLAEDQWRAFGAMVRQFHSLELPRRLSAMLPRETLTPSRRNLIAELQAVVTRDDLDPVGRELAEFWNERAGEIDAVVERADALARELRGRSGSLVLCHADMHPWNLLVDEAGEFWLVDWDETMLALKERDLMFVVGSGDLVGPRERAAFLQGYGASALDALALQYYRYAWAVQDIAAYGESVFFLPDQSDEARRDALRGFEVLFEPRNIVQLLAQGERD